MAKHSTRQSGEVMVRISGLDQRQQRFWQTTALSRITRDRIGIHAALGCCHLGDVLTVSFDKKAADYRVASIDTDDNVELIAVSNAECIFPRHLFSIDTEAKQPPA